MLLVIDVSNTNMVLGVFHGENLVANWRLSTKSGRTADETGLLICSLFAYSDVSVGDIEAIIVSSVVPDVMYSTLNGIKKFLKKDPIVVRAGLKTGINLRMENPKEMGTDRIVNLVAAYELYGGPAIVVDYGTANTFDVVNEKGEFITGFITAGIKSCAAQLYEKSSRLPQVELVAPQTVRATNTVDSLQIGIEAGHIGETIHIIETLKKELHLPQAKVIATGGLAQIMDPEGEIFDVYDPTLTLQGLRIIYEKNKGMAQ